MKHLKLLPLLLISAPMTTRCMDVSTAMYARCLIGGGWIAFSYGNALGHTVGYHRYSVALEEMDAKKDDSSAEKGLSPLKSLRWGKDRTRVAKALLPALPYLMGGAFFCGFGSASIAAGLWLDRYGCQDGAG